MEYLMTYGWAFLVIAVVIAVLVAMGVFSQQQSICKFDQVGFACANMPAILTNGTLYMRIVNGNPQAINVTNVVCTTDKSTALPTAPGTNFTNLIVMSQQTFDLNGNPLVRCVDINNAPVSLAAGTSFTGKVWVRYVNVDDPPGYPVKVAAASIGATAVR